MRASILNITSALLLATHASAATTPPANFADSLVAGGIASPTAFDIAPDGRIFVCQQNGQLRIVKNNALLPTPFLSVTVDSSGERGLLGVAFDPNFSTNNFVYVYYTVPASGGGPYNRVSRFTANGDVAAVGSEALIVRLDNLSGATNHNGGAIHFGPDGKLYIAVGDNANGANAQSLSTRHGKMLRLNSDGSIPGDNPLLGSTSGANQAIWALGLRNPFTFAFQPGTGRMFINDVGQSTFEEINDGIAGSNYGWPTTEGPTSNPSFRSPLLSYGHGSGNNVGCAITGGAFYPANSQFPAQYNNVYFYADYCNGWIRYFEPASGVSTLFATGGNGIVDFKVGGDGTLYYIQRNADDLRKVQYTPALIPSITVHPENTIASVGFAAEFTVSATGAAPLSYQWRRNNVDIPGATSDTYILPSPALSDHGAVFTVRVSNAAGNVLSNPATLSVTTNKPPSAEIVSPAAGALYSGGDRLAFSGRASDLEDGTLGAANCSWKIDFHHDTHHHPSMPQTPGIESGTFSIPNLGETSDNVFYRVTLTVTDSIGLKAKLTRDVLPNKAIVTLATQPPALQVTLDGQPQVAPLSFTGVSGILRSIGTTTPQSTSDGTSWAFARWSDKGAMEHQITTPLQPAAFTAVFVKATDADDDGIPNDAELDDDNDGVFDSVELKDGTNPIDALSFLKAPIAPIAMTARVRFDGAGKDSLSLSGTLQQTEPFTSLAGSNFSADIAGVNVTIALDKNGRGKSGNASVSLKYKKDRTTKGFAGGDLSFKLTLKKGDFSAAWADEGLTANASGTTTLPVTVTFNGRVYGADVRSQFSGRNSSTTIKPVK
ncbi:MAG TPA: PQQ-dependent sugar dehydrogenase [Planctomycetota bacterium]|nr:PQQ-dependent sugar dehydrogenase [Planctomycetota bacterium]